MFVNHDIARKTFSKLIENGQSDWIIISGSEKSGKTVFVKEVCKGDNIAYFEPTYQISYLTYIFQYLQPTLIKIIKAFFLQNRNISEFIDVKYANEIREDNFLDIICSLLNSKYAFEFSKFLGGFLAKQYKYLAFDNFYKCDENSYKWIIQFTEEYQRQGGYVIVICDLEKTWFSHKVFQTFLNTDSMIDITEFGNWKDYYEILQEQIFFENNKIAEDIAIKLFQLYKGNSQLFIKTILQYKNKYNQEENDNEKKFNLICISKNFTGINKLDQITYTILGVIALSPIKLNVKNMEELLEYERLIINEIVVKYENLGVLERMIDDFGNIYYCFTDSILRKIYAEIITPKQKGFIYQRLFAMSNNGSISIKLKNKLELAIFNQNISSEFILNQYVIESNQSIVDEKKAYYLSHIYTFQSHSINGCMASFDHAKLLYEYGYYKASLNMMKYLQNIQKDNNEYEFLILLGDIQHLLLHDEAPLTFKQASLVNGISISQKLSAVNRQIMALNQTDKQGSIIAKILYDEYLDKYKDEKCDGLIELYRNTNNSYSDEEALEYTIKGYRLALELHNELEMVKCIHNICMIRLHQNKYFTPLECIEGTDRPTFQIVYDFFDKSIKYMYERAYPLLDLGTTEMFLFIEKREIIHLKNAKNFYSQAQLCAKSFYAKHIAEMGLLITNTHIYKNDENLKKILCQSRKKIYQRFLNDNNIDYRVNRKILLSLSVSALIFKEKQEAINYLKVVKKYMDGKEIGRYNNLCILADIADYQLESPAIPAEQIIYYTCPEFVPWLISFGH